MQHYVCEGIVFRHTEGEHVEVFDWPSRVWVEFRGSLAKVRTHGDAISEEEAAPFLAEGYTPPRYDPASPRYLDPKWYGGPHNVPYIGDGYSYDC